MKNIKTFEEFINESQVNEAKKITVTTYGNKTHVYKDKDIKNMLSDFSVSSDDLPSWMYKAGLNGSPDFPKKPAQIKELLKKILNHKKDVNINVASDMPAYKLNIEFVGESNEFNDENQINEAVTGESMSLAENIMEQLATVFFVHKFSGSLKKSTLQSVVEELVPVVLDNKSVFDKVDLDLYKKDKANIVKYIVQNIPTY